MRERLDYVDGLRGIAVLMVVICHAWTQRPPVLWNPIWSHNKMVVIQHPTLGDYLANRGYQGVSLFLVLSGFCLSYPALKRRSQGIETWFQPSHFFARRFLRILPPYYVALALSIGLVALFHERHWRDLSAMGGDALTPVNIISHVLLLHNFTGYDYSINSPFWSLALEWQWYWLFPVILVFAVRRPLRVAVGCLALAMIWQGGMEDHSIIMFWLPGRLFEFTCGVLVARQVVNGFICRPAFLLIGAVAAIALAEAPLGTLVGDLGLYQPLYGVAFALILLLGHVSLRARRVFSWGPLVRMGVVSYSVYLVHRPVVDCVESLTPLWFRSTELMIPAAALAGVGAGLIFYLAVERVSVSKTTWRWAGPGLQRLLGWTDVIYGRSRPTWNRAPDLHPEPTVAAVSGG
jgi:peptidoglycan/LPS O-acetylase OafA/YrhL